MALYIACNGVRTHMLGMRRSEGTQYGDQFSKVVPSVGCLAFPSPRLPPKWFNYMASGGRGLASPNNVSHNSEIRSLVDDPTLVNGWRCTLRQNSHWPS